MFIVNNPSDTSYLSPVKNCHWDSAGFSVSHESVQFCSKSRAGMDKFFRIDTLVCHKHNDIYMFRNSCSRLLFMDSQPRSHEALNFIKWPYLNLRRRQIKSTATSNNTSAAETVTPTTSPCCEDELTWSFLCFPPEVGRMAWEQKRWSKTGETKKPL